MAYQFSREESTTFKLGKELNQDGESLTLKGVSASASADSVVAGVQGLLYIANRENDWLFDGAVRVVNEDVEGN